MADNSKKRRSTEDRAGDPDRTDPRNTRARHAPNTDSDEEGSSSAEFHTYSRSDYPHIHYWTKEEWIEVEAKRKDSFDPGARPGPRGGTRCAQGENVAMTYIEHSDGTAINGRLAAKIRRYARSIWMDFYPRDMAPDKWGDVRRKPLDEFTREMEKKFPVLRYCEDHWKVNYVATKNYPQWYKSYHQKMLVLKGKKKETNEPPQKKRRTRIKDDDDSHCQSDSETDTVDGPTPEALDEGSNHNNARPSWLEEDTQEEPRACTSRPRARPLRDPL